MDEKCITVQLGDCLLKQFDPNTMDYLKWLNSFEYIAEVLRTEPQFMTELLLNMLTPSAVTAIKNSIAPLEPSELSYEEITLALQKTYGKYQGKKAALYRFQTRNQLPDEPLQHYVLALKKLLSKCTQRINHQEIIKTRFIQGLENEETKVYLRQKSEDMTFATIISIAKQRELINKEIRKNFM